jgi:1,4-dihydroxy-2-naphthoyl-CoA hydrolase
MRLAEISDYKVGAQMIWSKKIDLKTLNTLCENTLVSHLEIKFTEVTDDSMTAVMPVNDTVKQPFGVVHGGANCALAETVGSVAASIVAGDDYLALGQTINTTHLKAVRRGVVKCVGTPIRIGESSQVWQLITYNDAEEKTSLTTLVMAIKKRL